MKAVGTVLLLGSGGLSIGQAGEFDYSGSQAIKALKEEGARVVLVNPNIATIQTSEGLADEIYFVPLTAEFVTRVIEKERPDGILLSFGGQTALNCGVALKRGGVLEKYGVRVLGTPVEAIETTEDRDLFVKAMAEIDVPVPRSIATSSPAEALAAADTIGYPVIVRAAYTLGGLGSQLVPDRETLEEAVAKAFTASPQLLVERSLEGWKEVEYEVVRDGYDNCVTVCNMENLDPLGIHTGESVVVAPSLTLSNDDYHRLRERSIAIVRHIGVVGECNVQFALDPKSNDFAVIEMNARLSRSSALASKATGYPLAAVAARLALGRSLPEIANAVTRTTCACFEPSLDYVVVKMPRWDLAKFSQVSRHIGTAMKSVGEVMSIGRCFEEALQKALRMVGGGFHGLMGNKLHLDDLDEQLANPTDERILAVAQALDRGYSIERIHELTRIDPWFLHRIAGVVATWRDLNKFSEKDIPTDRLRSAKQLGFSDFQIAKATMNYLAADDHDKTMIIRELRKKRGIVPVVKQIDTVAGEFPAETNYLYLTYGGVEDDVSFTPADVPAEQRPVVVLGSGPYRIGSSVEFDWCCVGAVNTLRELGRTTVMLNHNPETVSTDFDVCDRLYFDELTLERLLDIHDKEHPEGFVVSMGGQVPNNLAPRLARVGVPVLGTPPSSIDGAEDRHKFSALLDRLGVDQPEWREVGSVDEACAEAEKLGYPLLVRPSYVLSGAAMAVAFREAELRTILTHAAVVSGDHPVVMSQYITGAKELEIDAVAADGKLVAFAICEHVEFAGVHSGDATMVLPPQKVYLETIRRIKRIARELAAELHISGPFNMQFLARDNRVRVIECNLRASRSFPFCSKVYNVDFIGLATRAILGLPVDPPQRSLFELDYVGVKVPQFSFTRLAGADPRLGVEMASTGEVACLGTEVGDAYLKGYLSAGNRLPRRAILLSTGPVESKAGFLNSARRLVDRGIRLHCTGGTAAFLRRHDVPCDVVTWPLDEGDADAVELIQSGAVDLVINIPKNLSNTELTNGYLIRRAAVDFGVPLQTNLQVANLLVDSLCRFEVDQLECEPWGTYMRRAT